MIDTWLTETFNLAVPLIGAPMAGPGEGRLAAAVTAAGGLGMIGVGASRSPAWLREQAGRGALGAGAGQGGATPPAYGIGLMAWALDRDDAQLTTALALRPSLVSVSFGTFEPHVDRLVEAGIPVTVQVGNLDEARRAERAGVDFVVARGAEAGGHGRDDVATLPLLQAVLDRVNVPVVAAGGIATARGLAAVLAAGAAGAWIGTALLTTHEAANSPAARARLLAAGPDQTVYSRVFDVAQRLGWPAEYGGRSLHNAYVERWRGRLEELAGDEAAAEQLRTARQDEDYDIAYLYAGQAVGTLTAERPVSQLVAELTAAEQLLRGIGTVPRH